MIIAVYKQSKLVRLHCSSCRDIIDTPLQSFTDKQNVCLVEGNPRQTSSEDKLFDLKQAGLVGKKSLHEY